MPERLNKLQIRAKVFDILEKYTSQEDFDTKLHEENLKELNSFEDKKFVCEILLKELPLHQGIKLDAVRYILADIAELELVEDTIWSILKNPEVPDKQKELYLQLLRALGGKIDINTLMECMENFDNIVDEQTQGLLELATVNPEAQIDFLDFIMSLKPKEQLQLITSLHADFKGDELANILSPCLKIDISNTVKNNVIDILANSKSYLAVKPLKSYLTYSDDKDLKRNALKALNQLKSDGIDIDNEEVINFREYEICRETKFYKAFLSQVDGCGNQGLIFSRITNKGQIIMFSAVINCSGGIMDCFGLHSISVNDFLKVVSRFKANDYVVPITAETAKFKLAESEEVNNQTGANIPYEYICWSVYTCDIEENPIDYDALFLEKIDITAENLDYIYETEVFDSWFFEYDDNIFVRELIDFSIDTGKNAEDYMTQINNKIDEIFPKVYTDRKLEEYAKMLADCAFIFYLNNDFRSSNIAINISKDILAGDALFLKDMLRRSILQYLAGIVAQEETEKQENIFLQNKECPDISVKEAYDLLQKLEDKWDEERYE